MSHRIGIRTISRVEALEELLEGDYSDWTIYDSFLDSDATDTYAFQEAYFNKLETEILIIEYSSEKTKNYTIDTKTLSSATAVTLDSFDTSTLHASQSVLGTYVCHVSHHGDRLYIWKNGVIIKTLTEADLGITATKIRGVSISPSGKYIIVSGYITALSAMGWVVLVGS